MPLGNVVVQQSAPYHAPRPHFPSQQHSTHHHAPAQQQQQQQSGRRHSHGRRHVGSPVLSPTGSSTGLARSPPPRSPPPLTTEDSSKTITTLSRPITPRRRSSQAGSGGAGSGTPRATTTSGSRSPEDRRATSRMRERDEILAEQLSASWVVADGAGAGEFGMTTAATQRKSPPTEGPSHPPPPLREDDDDLFTRRPLSPPPRHTPKQHNAGAHQRSRMQTHPPLDVMVAKSSIRGYDPAVDEVRFANNMKRGGNTGAEMAQGVPLRRSLSADQAKEDHHGEQPAARRLGPARSAPAHLGRSTEVAPATRSAAPPLPPKPHSSDEAYRAAEHPEAQTQDRARPPFAFNASSREEEAFRARQARACEGLSSLCSQWHGSDYNRMKFGAAGAPFSYCPLTIMAPEHVREIMSAQAAYEHELAARSDDSLTASSSSDESWGRRRSRSSTASRATTVSDGEGPNVKTPVSAQTADLSDSWMCESPSKIDGKANLVDESGKSQQGGDALSEIAPSKIVDLHIEDPKPLREEEGFGGTVARPDLYVRRASSLGKRAVSIPGSPMQVDRPPMSRSNSDTVRNGLKEAMESQLELAAAEAPQHVPTPAKTPKEKENELKTSQSHPLNVSVLLPPKTHSRLSDGIEVPETALHGGSLEKPLLCSANKDIFVEVFAETNAASGSAPPLPATPEELKAPPSMLRLGNMLLSSCPGKKVRLDGPVRGRGAICRDLTADLTRIKEMGVGCIVCCLDDNELRFLGAPWDEYKQSALKVGLDVVRIPMPEGLTPASLVAFDEHVEKIVRRYTLKGIDVLAHCRGGIGRAGLTACAWAVKMGIVGPSPDLERYLWDLANDASNPHHLSPGDIENARVMSTVERVIYLIRRRRSVKAIETFEQVNFLAAYVAWLRRQAGVCEQVAMPPVSSAPSGASE